MKKFEDKRKVRRLVYSKVTIVFFAIILFVLGRAVLNAYGKYSLTQANEASALKEYEELQARRDALKNNLKLLDTERGLEQELRGKFNVAKPGEEVINIVE